MDCITAESHEVEMDRLRFLIELSLYLDRRAAICDTIIEEPRTVLVLLS